MADLVSSQSGADAVGLQKVVTVVDLEEVKKVLPKVSSDTVKGKLLGLVKKGFFESWKSLIEVQGKLDELALGPLSPQAVNGGLADLVTDGILGMRHTDRNRWKLAPDVVFEGDKGVS